MGRVGRYTIVPWILWVINTFYFVEASCSWNTLRENTLFFNDPAFDSSQASRGVEG